MRLAESSASPPVVAMLAGQIALCVNDLSLAATLLTSAPRRAVGRAQKLTFTYQAANFDHKFQEYVREADLRRDRRDWAGAEWRYWEALRLYPLHSGYMVQYAHMLKEQGKLFDSEMYYRSAFALSNGLEEIKDHLAYVYAKNGGSGPSFSGLSDKRSKEGPFYEKCTHYDIVHFVEVFLGRVPAVQEIVAIQRKSLLCLDLILHLIQTAEFISNKRKFLEVYLAVRGK
jgi:hypothetical protein